MKRTRFSAFICFLVFCIVTVLCGCQKEEKESDKKLPQIRVGGVAYEPYFYKDIDGEFTGIDVELAKEAFHRMGYEPVFVDVDIAKVDSALPEDIVDFCGAVIRWKSGKINICGPDHICIREECWR